MPVVIIHNIDFYSIDPDSNSISFAIQYKIDIGLSDLLEFTI